MASVDRRIFCFCHWGGENVPRTDGSASYVGGVTESFIVNSGIRYDDFVKSIFDRLGIEPLGKVLHFSVKYDKLQLILLKDQVGLDNLIEFNDCFAHVYVSKCEAEEVAAPIVDSARGSTTDIEAQQTECSEKRHLSRDHATSIPETSSSNDVTPLAAAKWGELLVGEGQAFENADAFRRAIYKYAIAKQFSYKLVYGNNKYITVQCTMNGCPWKVSVGREDATGQFSIRTFIDSHSHPLDQSNFKPKFSSKMMKDIIQEKVLDSPSCLPREVCEDSKRNFAITLTYKQAWRAKQKAKEVIDRKVDDSYKLIPWLCNRLIEVMPGTIAKWLCTKDNRFKQLFVSYECSIRGFHVGCRPLVFLDVYSLTGPYKGTLLVASSVDANNGMYPLAYGAFTSQDEEDWLWFLENLKLVVRDREVVIVSNRNPLILSGIGKIFGEDNHAHCFHCVQENFRIFIDTNRNFKLQGRGKEIAEKYLNDIAYARTTDAYNEALAKMCTFRGELYDWVIASGLENWSNVLFKKPRWDLLNSIGVEAFDAFFGEVRLLPVAEMMEAYHKKLFQYLQNKQSEIGKWKPPVGPLIEEKILENQKLGENLFASMQSDFEVKLEECLGGKEVVNLKLSTCTCLEWQMTGYPCRHACRAIALANMDVYQCVADWYKREVQEHIYVEVMYDLPKIVEAGVAGFQMVENGSTSGNNFELYPPARNKRPPGRPRKEQIEPQVLDVKRMCCSLCREVGHSRRTCKRVL